MAADDVVYESLVHVTEHEGGECFCDDPRIYRSFAVFTSVGLGMGHPFLLRYFSQLGDGMLGY